jgi:monovalent cation/proton antiporter MnhG/PhaG subunit
MNTFFAYAGMSLIALAFWQNILIATGMIKNKNAYTIMHIACINDSLSLPMSLIGAALLMISKGMHHEAIRTAFLCALVYICNPIASYALAKVAYFYENSPLDTSRAYLSQNKRKRTSKKTSISS